MRPFFLIILYILGFINCDAQQKDTIRIPSVPNKVIVVESPKSVSVKIDPKDSSYLKIKLFKTGYKVYLFKDSLSTSDINLIDKFISDRLNLLNRDKVFLIGDPTAKYEDFKNLKAVFRKYEICKFKIVTDPDIQ